MTENAVVVASNQKTNREPIMELSPGDVGHALRQLEPRQLVRSVHGARAQRYEHRLAQHYSLTAPQQALLALLLLRGPQTLHELVSRSERMVKLGGSDDARHALERLTERDAPLVVRLPKSPGQREERWMHLLCGPIDLAAFATVESPASARAEGAGLAARLDALEARVVLLEEALAATQRD
jgi:uncharacterized protein YceH (UPF0502 family)